MKNEISNRDFKAGKEQGCILESGYNYNTCSYCNRNINYFILERIKNNGKNRFTD